MEYTIGKKIAELRRAKGFTQEGLADKLNVSAQAVSKWENDLSCPDILLLPEIASLLGATVDELLSREPKRETELLPADQRKKLDDMIFRVVVNTAAGDKVRTNLPVPLLQMALEMGMQIPEIAGNKALQSLDVGKILLLVEKGVIGKLVEVESAEGDVVEVVVE